MTRFSFAQKMLLGFTTALLLNGSAFSAEAAREIRSLVFGVAPKYDVDRLERAWKPLLERVSELSKVNLKFESADSMEEFEKNLAAGTYDLVYINPYLYTKYHDSVGYNAFVKQSGEKDSGVIVVRKDSTIQSVDQLSEAQIAFPAHEAYGANELTQAQLQQSGVNVNAQYEDSESSVYRAVLKGEITAGAGITQTLSQVNPNIHDQLRVVWSSKKYTSSAMAAHPRVNQHYISSVKSALLSLDSNTRGRNLLRGVHLKGLEAAHDQDWNSMRSLKSALEK